MGMALLGEAHGAVNLYIVTTVLQCGFIAEIKTGSRQTLVPATLIQRQRGHPAETVCSLMPDRHVGTVMLDRLEGADGLTELLPDTGILHGSVPCSPRDTNLQRGYQQ